MAYTWSEFKTDVLAGLAEDATRRNLETFRTRLLRRCVEDLQAKIPSYREKQEAVYRCSDFAKFGHVSISSLPHNAFSKSFKIADVSGGEKNCVWHPLDPWPWERKAELVQGLVHVGSRGYYTLSEEGNEVWVYPQVGDCQMMVIEWWGYKSDYQDTDEVPFHTMAADCVAEYINAKICLKINEDRPLHDSHMNEFMRIRRSLKSNINSHR